MNSDWKNAKTDLPKGYKLVKENKSERMQLLVRPATKEAIKKAAAAQGLSMNDLVNNILDEYAERQGTVDDLSLSELAEKIKSNAEELAKFFRNLHEKYGGEE